MGTFSLFAFGFMLEKYRCYKQCAVWILRIQAIAMILFSLSLESSFFMTLLSSVVLG